MPTRRKARQRFWSRSTAQSCTGLCPLSFPPQGDADRRYAAQYQAVGSPRGGSWSGVALALFVDKGAIGK